MAIWLSLSIQLTVVPGDKPTLAGLSNHVEWARPLADRRSNDTLLEKAIKLLFGCCETLSGQAVGT